MVRSKTCEPDWLLLCCLRQDWNSVIINHYDVHSLLKDALNVFCNYD